MVEGLSININEEIKIVDIHHLPQYPIFFENKIKLNQPIIVKLNDTFSKQRFYASLRNLKQYNNKRKRKSLSSQYVYVTEHLHKELQQQKKKLLPKYKQAKV